MSQHLRQLLRTGGVRNLLLHANQIHSGLSRHRRDYDDSEGDFDVSNTEYQSTTCSNNAAGTERDSMRVESSVEVTTLPAYAARLPSMIILDTNALSQLMRPKPSRLGSRRVATPCLRIDPEYPYCFSEIVIFTRLATGVSSMNAGINFQLAVERLTAS